ncbi:hypothetical protein [Ktedonospora formicarum]|uniref:hypothetical protein n=1 Tax=Ktedonospora formicarum TaxID=2778364 RepID=UPI001C6924A4|nr:hypothetical protein [Ktedonospora formicarum]
MPSITVIPAIAEAPGVAIVPAERLTVFVARMSGLMASVRDCVSMLAVERAGGCREWR